MPRARKPLWLIEQPGNTFVVRGDAMMLLKAGGFRGVYSGSARGWILDRRRLPDLCAFLASRHVPYEVRTDGAA